MISFTQMFQVFGRIGLLSFGGPAAQIALMHSALVTQHRWLSEAQFLRALSLCMLLPGPEAMQLATYAGWRLRGTWGGLLAGALFVIPGAIVILGLAMAYIHFGQLPLVQAAFLGVKAAVIIIVLQALLRLARKAISGRSGWIIAGLSFVGLFAFGLPFPLIIACAGAFGYVMAKAAPVDLRSEPRTPLSNGHLGRVIVIFGGLWITPLLVLWATNQVFLSQIGLFFSKLAIVTFGGAYAVLAYMSQSIVQDFGWISAPEMIDALGMAETTPGPLILVTEFVALLAGFAQGGLGMALAAGALALWVTFLPCFLWIFAAGPYIEGLTTRPRLAAALAAISAAVVGVILNLSLWFALHVLFDEVTEFAGLTLPRLATLNLSALVLTLIAAILMIVLKQSMARALLIMAACAIALSLV